MTRVITPEFTQQAKELRSKGMSLRAIATQLDCSKTTVRLAVGQDGCLQRGGRKIRHAPRKLTHDQAREALEMYRQNVPSKLLVRHFGCAIETIHRAIKRLGVDVPKRTPLGPQHYLSADQVQEIKTLADSGVDKVEIAKQYRVSRVTVYRTLWRSV